MTRRKKTQFHGGGRQKNLANETPGDAVRRSKVSLGGSSVVMIISSWPGKKKEREEGRTKITGCIKDVF